MKATGSGPVIKGAQDRTGQAVASAMIAHKKALHRHVII
jgi:hypothetical protein